MSLEVSGKNCLEDVRNTGKQDCPFQPEIITGLFFVPLAAELTQADIDDIATVLQNKNVLDDWKLRWHKIGPFDGFDDKSVAPQFQTLGYRGQIPTDDGTRIYEYAFGELVGGFESYLDARSFNKKHALYGTILHDKINKLYTRFTDFDDDNAEKYGPLVLANIYVYPWTAPNTNKATEYRIRLTFAEGPQMDENLRIIKTGIDIDNDIKSVKDINIKWVADGAAGIYDLEIKQGDVNLAKIGFGITSSMLKATAEDDGAAVTITSVAENVTTGLYRVTLNTSDPDYDVSDNIIIDAQAVSVLAGLNKKYYESQRQNRCIVVAS